MHLHEDAKYSCNQCDYQVTTQGHLKRHIKSVHEGMIYFCDQCDYHTGRKDKVKEYKQRIHLSQE